MARKVASINSTNSDEKVMQNVEANAQMFTHSSLSESVAVGSCRIK